MSNPYPNYKRNTITVPAQKRPQNCGTSYCSCIECVMESAQQEPEFFTHNVEQPYDWSEWVCPDPQGYLMKCCDCGLVHEAEFGVVRYKSETEREDCDIVDDPNLQAVFRMRRSEQWSPVDTAHRAGGMPMEQPAQQEPVALGYMNAGHVHEMQQGRLPYGYVYPKEGVGAHVALYTSPSAQRTWVGLTDEEIDTAIGFVGSFGSRQDARAIEAKLKEKNT